eukprot:6575899-Prymnesium_polylepis.1
MVPSGPNSSLCPLAQVPEEGSDVEDAAAAPLKPSVAPRDALVVETRRDGAHFATTDRRDRGQQPKGLGRVGRVCEHLA